VNRKPATPKDAAAVILIRENKVLWARRNPNIKFLGGWHAFPGGKVEAGDAEISIGNCADADLHKFVAAAAREAFEEVGVLLVRGGEKLTRGQRASLHDDLVSGRSSFAEILSHWNLRLDARDFLYTGFWTTPQFSPVRFKTRFFIVECPPKQEPYAAISEMQLPEFVAPEKALERWANAEVLISPPVLIALQELKEISPQRHGDAQEMQKEKNNFISSNLSFENLSSDSKFSVPLRLCGEKLLEKSAKSGGDIDYIELNPRVIVFPLETETLPPATHTNCFIVGRREFVVVDAAARMETEQAKLFAFIDEFVERGFVCKEIIVSHSHADHFGGETILQKHLNDKFNLKIPVSAHAETVEALRGRVEFQKLIADEEIIDLQDENGANFELKAFHAPGHARGHLCFYDESKGFLLSSDNIVGAGTVVIAPPEGDMADYLTTLERLKNLSNLRFLCGSHGAAVFDARGKIEEYVWHRLEREKQISEAFENGAKTIREIAEKVYAGLKPELFRYAEKSVEAHLEKLKIRL
jgi:glyoxylase-like metal-dependent hydrolase (beta-lactamase superfamily II)/8-oxo-dGTP pyrophosphatase MutT (NUDIX family)